MQQSIKDSMHQGIQRSGVFVLLLSPDYARSENCLFEVREAVAANKPIVVCVVEPGFWKTWKNPADNSVVIPVDGELASLTNLEGILYVDFSSCSTSVDWSAADISPENRNLLQTADALPRLHQQISDIRKNPIYMISYVASDVAFPVDTGTKILDACKSNKADVLRAILRSIPRGHDVLNETDPVIFFLLLIVLFYFFLNFMLFLFNYFFLFLFNYFFPLFPEI